MALNSSGAIALAGSTAGESIAVELGASATGQIALNDSNVRGLAGVASGTITMPTNFYGKSFGPALGTVDGYSYPWDINGFQGQNPAQYSPTNAMVWQMFYARRTLQFNSLNCWASANGNNSWTWHCSNQSTNPDNFGTGVINLVSGGGEYSANSLIGQLNTSRTIDQGYYFMIGMSVGPYFKMLRNSATNRTLNGYVTAINRAFYKDNSYQGQSPAIPSQVGGNGTSFDEFPAIWQWRIGFV